MAGSFPDGAVGTILSATQSQLLTLACISSSLDTASNRQYNAERCLPPADAQDRTVDAPSLTTARKVKTGDVRRLMFCRAVVAVWIAKQVARCAAQRRTAGEKLQCQAISSRRYPSSTCILYIHC